MLTRLIENTLNIIILSFLILTFFLSYIFASEELKIEIDNPRFSEKGLDNRLYEIKADKGIQKENNLELFNVEGKLRSDNGIWIYLNAEQGRFDQLNNIIELEGKITFYTNENDKLYSDFALFSIDDDLAEFNKNVKHIKGYSIITSDISKIKNNFNHIIYEGNVSTLYDIE